MTPPPNLESAFRTAVSFLPENITQDYRLALAEAPDLILQETDPLTFFRCEKGNLWSAARRFVLHWTLRREVFGDERWLRKMDLSGTGAMNADDITLLHTGVFALVSSVLPGGNEQQQAMLVNFSRLNGRDPGPSRHRVFMFLMYSLNAYTQENGLIVLMSLPGSGVRVRSDNGKMLQESYRSQVFWVRGIFLIHDPNDTRQMLVRTFAAMIASIVRRVLERVPQMIVAPDREMTMYLLQSHAVDLHLIPEHLGGFWSYRYFDEWLDGQLRPPPKTEFVASTFWDVTTPAESHDHSQQQQLLLQEEQEAPVIGTSLIFQASRDLKNTTKRQLPAHVVKLRNSASAKQRYEKRKQEVQALRNHEQELRRQNTALHRDNKQLEELLDHALSLIQNYT